MKGVQAKYRAFISYSHRDKVWGDWLHKGLERYRVPNALIGKETGLGQVPKSLFPVFRDREELPTSSDLGSAILDALTASAMLIVICSPNSARSRWVNEEIKSFKRLHGESRVLAIIVDGEPNGTDKPGFETLECFPHALRYAIGADGELSDQRTEPIAADARPAGDGKDDSLLKLIAGLLGVNYDDLKRREVVEARKRARRAQAVAALMALLAVTASGFGYYALEKREEADTNAALAAEQRNAALTSQSRFLSDLARQHVARDEFGTATLLALEALPNKTERFPASISATRPFVAEAEKVLHRSMRERRELAVFDIPVAGLVRELFFDREGKRLIAFFDTAAMIIMDAETGTELKRIDSTGDGPPKQAISSSRNRVAMVIGNGQVRILGTDNDIDMVLNVSATEEISKIRLNVDGSRLAVLLRSGRLLQIDVASKNIVASIETNDSNIYNLAYAPTGSLLAYEAEGIMLWNGVSEPVRLYSTEETVDDIAFSPDGNYLVTVHNGGERFVTVFGLATAEQRVIEAQGQGPYRLTFHPNGNVLAVRDGANRVEILNLADGTWLSEFGVFMPDLSAIPPTAFAQDGRLFAVSTRSGGGIQLTDSTYFLERGSMTGHLQDITALAFSPDSKVLAATSNDGSLRMWTVAANGLATILETGDSSGEIENPVMTQQGLSDVRFNSDGSRVALGDGKKISLWSVPDGVLKNAFGKSDADKWVLAFDRKKELTVAARPGEIVLSSADHFEPLGKINGYDDIENLLLSPDNKRLVVQFPTHIGIWDISDPDHAQPIYSGEGERDPTFLADGKLLVRGSTEMVLMDSANGRVTSRLKIPDGLIDRYWTDARFRWLAAGNAEGAVTVWDLRTLKIIATVAGVGEAVLDVVFDSNADRMAVLQANRELILVLLTAPENPPKRLDYDPDDEIVDIVSFRDDGRALALAGRAGQLVLVDAISGTKIAQTKGDITGRSLANAFVSTDDNRFISSGGPQTLVLRDLETFEELAEFTIVTEHATGYVWDAAVSPGFRYLVVGSTTGYAKLWPLFGSTQALADAAKHSLPRCFTQAERQMYFLPKAPPRWCITGAGLEDEPDPALWKPKWPYRSKAWRNWLIESDRAGGTDPVPMPMPITLDDGS